MRFTLRGDVPVRKYGQSNSNANGGDRSTRLARQRRNANLNLDHNNGGDSRLSANSANEAAGGLSLTILQRRTTTTTAATRATSSTNRTSFTIRPFGRGNDREDDGEDENDSGSSSSDSEGDDDDDDDDDSSSDLESLVVQPSKRSFGEMSKNDSDDENNDNDNDSDSNSDDDCFVVVDRRKRQRIQIPILPGASLPSINGRDSSPIDLDDDSDSDGSDSKSESGDDNDDDDDDDDDEAISFSFTNRPAERRRSRRLNQQNAAKNDKDSSDDDNTDSDMEVLFKIEPRSPQLEFQIPAARHHAHQTRFNIKTRKARPLSPPPASPPPAEPSRSSRSGLSRRPGRGGRGSNVVSSARSRSTRSRQCSNHPPEPLPTIEPLPTMPRHEMYPGSSVLVFYPTMEEFANFEKFVTTIEPIAAINGICKVVPPAEWRRELEMNVCQNNPPPPKPDSIDINQHSSYFTNEYPSVSIKQEHGSVRIKSEYGPVRVKKEGGKNDTDEESIEILSTTSPHVESALQKSVASSSTRISSSSSLSKSSNGKSSASSTSMEESETAHLEKMKNCAFLEDSMYQVQQPIVQHFRGKDGILRLLNVDYYKPSLPLSEYFEMCVSIDHAPPSHLFIGERNSHTQHPIRLTGSSTVHQQLLNHIPRDNQYYQSGNNKSGLIVDYSKGIIRPCYPLRRRYEKNSAVKFRPLSSGTQSQQYVARHGGKVEQDYWQNITSESPMYGADISGSLFPPPEQFPVWNLRRLDSILNRVTISMTGINNPYLYIGMYRSTFAWHAEDLDMYSINYLHCGSPKSWFAIPLDQADDFEAFAKDQFPSSHRRCTEFIRHKSFHFSPSAISNSTLSGKDSDGAEIKHRTPVQAQRCVQNPGEFMITFPRGYHAGFNQGFNVAEAVNFAMPRWVQIGRRARVCQCSDESVRMEIDQWFPDQQVEDPVSIRVEHRKLVRRIWSIIAPLIEADRD